MKNHQGWKIVRKFVIWGLLIFLNSCAGSLEAPIASSPPENLSPAPPALTTHEKEKPIKPETDIPSFPPLEKKEEKTEISEDSLHTDKKPADKKPEVPNKIAETTVPLSSPSSGDASITFNFDQADIREVIHTALGEILKVNYIIGAKVRGKVTLRTAKQITPQEVLPLLETLLKMNGITLVKGDNLYQVIPFSEVPSYDIPIYSPRETNRISQKGNLEVITQLVSPKYLSPSGVSKLLKPFLTPKGKLQSISKMGLLTIVDTAENVRKLLHLIELCDVEAFRKMKLELFMLDYTEAKQMASELESIFSVRGLSLKEGVGVKITPVNRLNALLVVASSQALIDEVEKWAAKLDQEIRGGTNIYVYFVENAKAPALAGILAKLYGKDNKSSSPRVTSARSKDKKASKAKDGKVIIQSEEVKIIADEATNALIIQCNPEEYRDISQTIMRLDIVPAQILINVLFAEVTLNDQTQFGIEWFFNTGAVNVQGGSYTSSLEFNAPTMGSDMAGFNYTIMDATQVRAYLHAITTTATVNILASPHIMASDNQEATIEIGQEVPIVTSEYVPSDEEDRTTRSVQYRNTGVILKVKPHINSAGMVTLEIDQEVSEAQLTTTSQISSPTILNRKAKTTMVAQDGQTVVIGGIISETLKNNREGIPILCKIPLLGWLFSYTDHKIDKTELIIMITPHVLRNKEEIDHATSLFNRKLKVLRRLIEEFENPEAGNPKKDE